MNHTQEKMTMEQEKAYRLDLTKIEGNGDFPCPKCRNIISPEDSTEEEYSVLESKVNRGELDEIVILCDHCGSQIHLTGFSLLKGID